MHGLNLKLKVVRVYSVDYSR